jgi:adenylate cyclase
MFSRTILVVDDEAVFADLCRTTLAGIGHEVICVSDGEHAVEIAQKQRIDLVLINSHLSGADGRETFAMLRQMEHNLIGILVIDHKDTDTIIAAVNDGFSAILKKPAEGSDILQRVIAALTLTRIREENIRLKTLIPLYQLGRTFLSATTATQVYAELVEVIHQELAAPCVSVMMLDSGSGQLRVVAAKGMAPGVMEQVRLQPGEKIAGWVFAHGKPVILNRKTQQSTPFAALLKRTDIAASISFPLSIRGNVAGVVNISDRNVRVEYSQADMEMLSVICGQAIMALEHVMAIEEREQAVRLRTLFEQYVAPEVAEYLLNREERMLDVGEVRDLTVLFADIRNFTGLVQHVPPEDLRLFLNQFLELFTNIIFSARGTLDKFMGDAALVLFGAPMSLDAPAEAAVGAAVQIMSGFDELRSQWIEKSHWFVNIGIGIGISSGEVYLGNVGSISLP